MLSLFIALSSLLTFNQSFDLILRCLFGTPVYVHVYIKQFNPKNIHLRIKPVEQGFSILSMKTDDLGSHSVTAQRDMYSLSFLKSKEVGALAHRY